MCGFFYSNMSYMTNNATLELMRELDESVQRVKELNRIINKLHTAIICDSEELEDMVELTRTYANYSIRDLENSYLHTFNNLIRQNDKVVPFPIKKRFVHSDEDA